MRSPRIIVVAFAVAAVALIAAGCGGSSSPSTTTAANAGGSSAGAGTATGSGTLGTNSSAVSDFTVLTDSKGMTVYMFEKDQNGKSACYGPCAQEWPPVMANGKPTASGAIQASLLGTTKRKDGGEQVTYKGMPLYTFVEDTAPGQANGNGLDFFGGEWYALQTNGQSAEAGSSGTASSTADSTQSTTTQDSSSGGGGRYGGY
jgi:predicted lipoprotein with Yx(FWY)xxD motif